MSDIRFRTTSNGNLTHFSYILRKPEPLVTFFNTRAYYDSGDLILIYKYRGKEGMNNIKHHLDLMAILAYKYRIA